jgi:para-aminobenzoate synthetase/4-amino-4-deoxychorismate lyase
MAGPDDTAVFNVAIRTVVLDEEEGTMGVGSGVVWDSDPDAEYAECALKGEFLTRDAVEGRDQVPDDI